MRGNKYSLLLLLSLVVIPVGFAAAANSQGLSWGVSVGDEFRFNVVFDTNIAYSSSYTEVVIVTITAVSTLPDTVTSTSSAYVSHEAEFVNGTDTYLPIIGPLAAPIGNWAVYSVIIAEAIADAQEATYYDTFDGSVIDSLSIWGYTVSMSDGSNSQEMTIHLSKSDGMLNYMSYRTDSTTTDDYTLFTTTREGYLGGMLGFDPMIAIIGVIGAIAVIVIIVIIVKR